MCALICERPNLRPTHRWMVTRKALERPMMPLLARFKIITKIIAVVLLLSAVTASVSWLGVRALSSLNDSADIMKAAAARALQAARANQSVIVLNRAEFRVALDPSVENRAAVRTIIDEQMKLYEAAIAGISQT